MNSQLLADVAAVLKDADKHRYSASKVYAAYNTVTGKSDPVQTCSSCLRNRVRTLREWYAKQEVPKGFEPGGFFFIPDSLHLTSDQPDSSDYKEGLPSGMFFQPNGDTAPSSDEEQILERVDPLPDDLDVTGFPEPPIDVIRLHVPVLELPVYFEPGTKGPNKGKAYYQGGGAIKPGKYVTSDDRELAVQPGGKATLKAAPDNDLL